MGTCAGPLEGNGQHLVDQFSALVDYAQAKLIGKLFVPLCTAPEQMPEDAKLKAAEFVNQIVA